LEEAWPVVSPLQFVPVGSSLLTQSLFLRFFNISTSNTSKCLVIIVLWFVSLLYSFCIESRVIISSVSMVFGLGYS
jgi:hypothetical protein